MNEFKYTGESTETSIQTKTYFWTNTLVNRFPPEFVSSKNRKWIVVQGCKATFKDKLVGDDARRFHSTRSFFRLLMLLC